MARHVMPGYILQFSFVVLLVTCQVPDSESVRQSSSTSLHKLDRSVLPDSLRERYKDITDLQVYDSLYREIIRNGDKDNKLALFYCEQLKKVTRQLGDSLKIVGSHRLAGQLHRRIGDVDGALSELNAAVRIAQRNDFQKELSTIYNALGVTYTYRSDYDDALQFHLLALELRKKAGDKEQISITLHNIGFIHFYLEDYETALTYYEECLKLKREVGYTFDLDILHINISSCYRKLGMLERAMTTADSGFLACSPKCSERMRMVGELSYGSIFFEKKQFDSAAYYLQSSYDIALKTGDKIIQGENLILLGQIKVTEKNYIEAENIFLEGLKQTISAKYGSLTMMFYSQLMTLSNIRKNYPRATHFQTEYIAIRDSIYGNQVRNKLAALQVETKARNDQLIIAHKEELIQSEKTQKILVATILVLLLIIMAALLIILRNKQRLQRLLDQKVTERTRELEENRFALEQSVHWQTSIMSKTIQDIKAPLATIRGVSEIALNEIKNGDARVYFEKMELAVRELASLVERSPFKHRIET